MRYSFLDLNDKSLRGGNEHNITLGVNCYLYSNVKIMANYVFADFESTGMVKPTATRDDGTAHIFQTRAQIAF